MTETFNFRENCLKILSWLIVANWEFKYRKMYFLALFLIWHWTTAVKLVPLQSCYRKNFFLKTANARIFPTNNGKYKFSSAGYHPPNFVLSHKAQILYMILYMTASSSNAATLNSLFHFHNVIIWCFTFLLFPNCCFTFDSF